MPTILGSVGWSLAMVALWVVLAFVSIKFVRWVWKGNETDAQDNLVWCSNCQRWVEPSTPNDE